MTHTPGPWTIKKAHSNNDYAIIPEGTQDLRRPHDAAALSDPRPRHHQVRGPPPLPRQCRRWH